MQEPAHLPPLLFYVLLLLAVCRNAIRAGTVASVAALPAHRSKPTVGPYFDCAKPDHFQNPAIRPNPGTLPLLG